MDPSWFILIEIICCLFVSFFLVYYYSRRRTNILALLTAGFTWWFNFILIVFIPYDIYYTYSENLDNKEKHTIINILDIGYQIVYWTLFICSWIFIPLMQEYEDSGDFTKKRKFFRSIKNNLIFYGILGAVAIVFIVAVFLIENELSLIYSLMNCSYLIGLILFYFLFGYSVTSLPFKIFCKANYEKEINYLEWRTIDFKKNLEKIQKELVDDGYLLQSTLENFNIMKRVNKSKSIEDDENSEDDDQKLRRNKSFSSSILTDYSKVINERYDYLYDNQKVFGIELRINTVDNDKEPLNNVEELIKLNRKINKNEWDNLRIQIRIRNQYKRWLILSTILYENKNKNRDLKNDNLVNKSSNNEEQLIPENDTTPLEVKKIGEDGFIPYKNLSNFDIIYYNKLNRPILYFCLSIVVLGGLLMLISQICGIFRKSPYGFIVYGVIKADLGLFGLHFFIMIPIIFLFVMSIYTFFRLKISGYFYMYKNKQTDSVSLMYFSTNLCRISFSICLDFIFNINGVFRSMSESNNSNKSSEDQNNYNNSTNSSIFTISNNNITTTITRIQKMLNFHQDEGNKESGLFFEIYQYSSLILLIYVLILLFKLPQKMCKLCGKNIYETKSDESMNDIKEGHDYYMELNKKYDGEEIPEENLKLPEDKYNK